MYKKIIVTGVMLQLVIWGVAQNNVGIGTANPAAKLDVQGNMINYDVLNVANDRDGTPDSLMVFSSDGNLGIGVPVPGPYKLVTHGLFPTAFSPQVEVWQGDPNAPGSLMLADINDVGAPPFTGILNLYLNGSVNVAIQALGNSYLNGGNLGVGVTNPLERIHLPFINGAIVLGSYGQPVGAELSGTIEWNGSNFVGWTGPGTSVFLDAGGQPPLWGVQGMPYGFLELYPISPPASISMGFPGAPNQGGIIWIPDQTWPGQIPHQLMLESTTNLQTDASMLFRMSAWTPNPPWTIQLIDEYSQGIFAGDLSFKIFKGPVLGPTFQSDFLTMFRANPSGIIDFPNQSRVRAFQDDPSGLSFQLIPPNTWTPVNFTFNSPLPQGYDEQGEFLLAASVNQAVPPENAYFVATTAGYYQVNARCEFNVDEYFEGGPDWQPVQVAPDSYVSIAIYSGPNPAGGSNTSRYAEGNKLQIGYRYGYQFLQPLQLDFPPYWEFMTMDIEVVEKLRNNNAPNVSDVVFLQAGEVISIWVYHTAMTPMNLNYWDPVANMNAGDKKIYVSIHKVS